MRKSQLRHLKAALEALAAEDSPPKSKQPKFTHSYRGLTDPPIDIKIIIQEEPRRPKPRVVRSPISPKRRRPGRLSPKKVSDAQIDQKFHDFCRVKQLKLHRLFRYFRKWRFLTDESLRYRQHEPDHESPIPSDDSSFVLVISDDESSENVCAPNAYRHVFGQVTDRIVTNIVQDESDNDIFVMRPHHRAFTKWLMKMHGRETWRREIVGGIQRALKRDTVYRKRPQNTRTRKVEPVPKQRTTEIPSVTWSPPRKDKAPEPEPKKIEIRKNEPEDEKTNKDNSKVLSLLDMTFSSSESPVEEAKVNSRKDSSDDSEMKQDDSEMNLSSILPGGERGKEEKNEQKEASRGGIRFAELLSKEVGETKGNEPVRIEKPQVLPQKTLSDESSSEEAHFEPEEHPVTMNHDESSSEEVHFEPEEQPVTMNHDESFSEEVHVEPEEQPVTMNHDESSSEEVHVEAENEPVTMNHDESFSEDIQIDIVIEDEDGNESSFKANMSISNQSLPAPSTPKVEEVSSSEESLEPLHRNIQTEDEEERVESNQRVQSSDSDTDSVVDDVLGDEGSGKDSRGPVLSDEDVVIDDGFGDESAPKLDVSVESRNSESNQETMSLQSSQTRVEHESVSDDVEFESDKPANVSHETPAEKTESESVSDVELPVSVESPTKQGGGSDEDLDLESPTKNEFLVDEDFESDVEVKKADTVSLEPTTEQNQSESFSDVDVNLEVEDLNEDQSVSVESPTKQETISDEDVQSDNPSHSQSISIETPTDQSHSESFSNVHDVNGSVSIESPTKQENLSDDDGFVDVDVESDVEVKKADTVSLEPTTEQNQSESFSDVDMNLEVEDLNEDHSISVESPTKQETISDVNMETPSEQSHSESFSNVDIDVHNLPKHDDLSELGNLNEEQSISIESPTKQENISDVDVTPSASQSISIESPTKQNSLSNDEDFVDVDFESDDAKKTSQVSKESQSETFSDVDVDVHIESDPEEPADIPVIQSSSSSSSVDVVVEADSSDGEDIPIENSDSDDDKPVQTDQPVPAKQLPVDEVLADLTSSSEEDQPPSPPSKLGLSKPSSLPKGSLPEVPADLVKEVKKQAEPPKPTPVSSFSGFGKPRVPTSPASSLLQRLSNINQRKESREREYMKQFFTEELFNTIKQKKANGQFIPMIQVPSTVTKPFGISNDYSDLIVELLNETVDSQDLGVYGYVTFLDKIEAILNSGGQWTLKSRLTFPPELSEKMAKQHEYEQVASLLALADELMKRELENVLKK